MKGLRAFVTVFVGALAIRRPKPTWDFISDVCPKSRWVLLLIPWYPWLILQEEVYLCMLMSGLHLFSNS